jgi:N-acyl-D-aspartate/D-glutamate deacylase
MFDRVIRGGLVVDGTGRKGVTADVAIRNGVIVEVGRVSGAAREVIDADGLLVTPGWVDIHTHYDGQVTWDSKLEPSFWHGVSTVVFGNCGVGFAPVMADRREWLIQMMEGVEDIPGTALSDGIRWSWETFPEYLDAIDRSDLAIDIGAQIAHGPLRAYVMGERGAMNEPATEDDIAAMARAVAQAQAAGGLGISTSRTVVHRAVDGEPVPGTFAAVEELRALARAVAESGHGVMEVAPAGLLGEDLAGPAKELAWMNAVSAETGCPITFLTGQNHIQPTWWREQLAECGRQRQNGAMVVPQMFCRAIGIMVSLESKLHPFMDSPTYRSLSRAPYARRIRMLQMDAELRRRVALEGVNDVLGGKSGFSQWKGVYALGAPCDYEPAPEASIAATAKREGRDPREVALDVLLADEGHGFLHRPVMGYADGNLDPTYELLASPLTVPGGSDGGAHVATICDAGAPTYLLSHWARDRVRGPRLPIEHVVRKQTWDSARLYGLNDRGRIMPGLKADINLIDFDNLQCTPLTLQFDLPTGAPRLMQKADGYVATFVAGDCVTRHGQDAGGRAGKLVRGGQLQARL